MKGIGSFIYVYVDTSVFGGIFDDEFACASKRFFELVDAGKFKVCVSSVVVDELNDAPREVSAFYKKREPIMEVVTPSENAIILVSHYVKASIIAPRWEADAMHVALATIAGCSLIVSWNFKHIVNFRKIPLYNAINRLNGYGEIGIYTPREVIENEED